MNLVEEVTQTRLAGIRLPLGQNHQNRGQGKALLTGDYPCNKCPPRQPFQQLVQGQSIGDQGSYPPARPRFQTGR